MEIWLDLAAEIMRVFREWRSGGGGLEEAKKLFSISFKIKIILEIKEKNALKIKKIRFRMKLSDSIFKMDKKIIRKPCDFLTKVLPDILPGSF